MARRAYDAMCERALYRPVKHGLLRDTQTVQAWIADSAAEMQAARLMTLHAAWRIDQDGSSAARTDVSMIKFFGAKVLHDVVDRAVQIHGALGYSGDMPLEMLYRFARHARFVDGADEVHREMVARHALRATGRRTTACRASTSRRAARRPCASSPTCLPAAAVRRCSLFLI